MTPDMGNNPLLCKVFMVNLYRPTLAWFHCLFPKLYVLILDHIRKFDHTLHMLS